MRVGIIQLNSGDDPATNLTATSDFIRAAAAQGAKLVATPEVTNCVSLSRSHQHAVLRTEEEDQTLAALCALSQELGIWTLIGSLALKSDGPRFVNRSFLISPAGGIVARYDKIHMFDVDLADGEVYRESDGYRPGETAVIAPLPESVLGMTICYDLRFPALYRALAQAGAGVIAIPSAFTVPTGRAHWEVLLRARAIENGCFVLAPAQTGTHPAGTGRKQRETYGHSMVINPWGKVLLDMRTDPGAAVIDLNLLEIDKARASVPSLRHDRSFAQPGSDV